MKEYAEGEEMLGYLDFGSIPFYVMKCLIPESTINLNKTQIKLNKNLTIVSFTVNLCKINWKFWLQKHSFTFLTIIQGNKWPGQDTAKTNELCYLPAKFKVILTHLYLAFHAYFSLNSTIKCLNFNTLRQCICIWA